MMKLLLIGLALTTLATPVLAAGRAIAIDDLLAIKTVSDPQISPDGKLVVYVVGEVDRAADKSSSDLWIVPTAGGEPKRLTTATGSDSHPRWSPDGKSIAFQSTRGGSSQIWLIPVDGGEARPLTTAPIDLSGPIWSPKGDAIVCAGEVYPGLTPAQTAAKDKEKSESKTKSMTFDHLMIRHWTTWDEGKRSHLFAVDAKTGALVDLTADFKVNVPPAPFGGSSDYAVSPDGAEVAFTAEPLENHAWSTNSDIWVAPIKGGPARNLTAANKAADAQPSYSPDGKYLGFLTQARPGFEADQWVFTTLERATGTVAKVTAAIDRTIQAYSWTDASDGILAVIDDDGGEPIVALSATKSEPKPTTLIQGGVNTSFTLAQTLVAYLHHDASRPAEVFVANNRGGAIKQLTRHNAELVGQLDLPPAERFEFKGADGDRAHGFVLKPPGFDASKKYPVVFLIHGGPQGAWHDEWHARWNYAMFTSPGYVAVAINPRGSTGYGQKFTDQISGDWNGRVYEDLMKGLDHALKTYPYLDGTRTAAAGGSYGGYMVDWLAGASDRFKALISHAGVFDLASMGTTTEELWFSEWEFGGTPWDKPENYRKATPSAHIGNFKTPTLVLHGALDFRVPEAQGIGMFTALQRQGVPSRLVYFPDEGHWVVKPGNRVVWWREVHAWLSKYLSAQDK